MCIFPLAIFINNWVSVAPRWSCKDGKAGKAGNPMRALLLGRSLGNPIGALGETLEISIGPPLARKNAGNPCWAPPWLEKTLEILTGPVLDRQALLILGTTILGTTDFDRLTCRQKATCGNLVYIYMCIYIYVCMYVHVCVCMYVRVYECKYVCHTMPSHVMPYHVISCSAMPCHAMSHHVVSCHIMTCTVLYVSCMSCM